MNQRVSEQKIQEITKKIVNQFHPQKIILFGSYAWGEPRENSDVDLFIVQESDKPRLERQFEIRLALFPPGLSIDLLVYTPKEIEKRLQIDDFFIREILTKGKIVYDAKS